MKGDLGMIKGERMIKLLVACSGTRLMYDMDFSQNGDKAYTGRNLACDMFLIPESKLVETRKKLFKESVFHILEEELRHARLVWVADTFENGRTMVKLRYIASSHQCYWGPQWMRGYLCPVEDVDVLVEVLAHDGILPITSPQPTASQAGNLTAFLKQYGTNNFFR